MKQKTQPRMNAKLVTAGVRTVWPSSAMDSGQASKRESAPVVHQDFKAR